MATYHEQQMAEARRIAATIPKRLGHCGDILDRLPCVRCGAGSLWDCPVTKDEAAPVCDLINSTEYLAHVLRLEADAIRRAALQQGGSGE